MEDPSGELEVLYETRHHASRPYSYDYPPQQASGVSTGSFLSKFSVKGVSQLRQRWSESKQPRKLKKLISLFVSSSGKYVAVAAGNQITFLQKEDDYQNPCGVFLNKSLCTYTVGAWSEYHDVLGVADDTETLYLIKANGGEIARILRKNIKVPLSIVGLIMPAQCDSQRPSMSGFTVVISDGSLQHIEIGKDTGASFSSACISNDGSTLRRQYQSIFCLDYHPKLFVFIVVGGSGRASPISKGNSGCCYLTFWRRNSMSDMEHLFGTEFDGCYSKEESFKGPLSSPKVLISPLGTLVATLDVNGDLHIFKLDYDSLSIVSVTFREKMEHRDLLSDVADFTWWSDQILALAKRNGALIMVDVLSGLKIKDKSQVYSLPVLERVNEVGGQLFILETTSMNRENLSAYREQGDLQLVGQIAEYSFDSFDCSKLQWKLTSFSERSILEMYSVLISGRSYQAALEFADQYGLDKDHVIKAQWLHSDQGQMEINYILSNVKDRVFVLSQCLEKVGPTEDSVKALLDYGLQLTDKDLFSSINDENRGVWETRMSRLKLLHYRDRLETFMGINMGRFSVQEYSKFRSMPVNEAAVGLAESGKIGSLNLLFKRHPYSVAPFMLEILAAIPETVQVHTYGQLLPGASPPPIVAVREEDWVECDKMVDFIKRLPSGEKIPVKLGTEPIVKRCLGYFWPSADKLSRWYKRRAIDIDSFSGQLDNSLCLIDIGWQRGITGLQHFRDDITYLNQLIYIDDTDAQLNISLSLLEWEQLVDYEKFKMMLQGVEVETVVRRLTNKAIPFMKNRLQGTDLNSRHGITESHVSVDSEVQSFLVRWVREIALENKLDMCLMVFEEGCKDFDYNRAFFKDEAEAVDCALQCLYLCSSTEKWSTMATMLSKLPQMRGFGILERRLKAAEGHVEAGKIMAFYQVPKPMSFLLEAHTDEKGVKQIFRLILSKFIRCQPGQSDNDWASMWRDMQVLREKAFTFLDPEYMLIEFCRGLLKAGKFSLVRNYLKGTNSVVLAPDKAENLVIQAAREYFFSASSLTSSEIWKAKECLSLFPGSSNTKAEADIIDALTDKLPRLGMTLLPMQFRQIKDPMEIIKMAITSQPGAYLNVDELIEVSKLLGLNSKGDISTVEEAIAREAAVAGDLHLAFDLCLGLVKMGHGLIWDLCAAIARGPALENMDVSSRKVLIGFALSHCDEESIPELLHAWKDLDMQGQCETMMVLSGTSPPNLSLHPSVISHDMGDFKESSGTRFDDEKVHLTKAKEMLCAVTQDLPSENEKPWESLLTENEKIFSFALRQLPWLIELSQAPEHGKQLNHSDTSRKGYKSIKTQAMIVILSWLVKNGFSPRDDVIVSLAKSVLQSPATEDEDILGCSFLLNLMDAFHGVQVIEEQLKIREDYQEISSIMNIGMKYGLLHNSGVECQNSTERRELLLRFFREKHVPHTSGEMNQFGKVESTFWRDWKLKLEGQKCIADQTRVLEQIIPGVEAARFLSGEFDYIQSAVFSLVDSLQTEKKHILKDILKLSSTYGVNRIEVLIRFLSSLLVSGIWTNEEIDAEIAEVKKEIIGYSEDAIKSISETVFPAIDGRNKERLAYVYGLLADCYTELEGKRGKLRIPSPHQELQSSFGFAQFYKVVEQECRKVSFIKNLDFKNIAGLDGLNLHSFSTEVTQNLDEYCLDALAKMVESLASIYTHPLPTSCLGSGQSIYKHYILSSLASLESKTSTSFDVRKPENFQELVVQLEQSYDSCRTYMKMLAETDVSEIFKRYFRVGVPYSSAYGLPDSSAWQECLIILINFFIRLAEEMQEALPCSGGSEIRFEPRCLVSFFKSLVRFLMEDSISPSQGWATLVHYIKSGFDGDFIVEVPIICKAMIFSGCSFGVISEVFSDAVYQYGNMMEDREIRDLAHIYLDTLEPILQDLAHDLSGQQELCNLLSSLSKTERDMKSLAKVRHVIWRKLADFSNGSQLPGQIRVYVLELMQFVIGRQLKGASAELQSKVLPWEGWDEESLYADERSTSDGPLDHSDASSNFTSTLVALRSSQIVSAISQSLEINPDDLTDISAAVSCFMKLCEAASAESHLNPLLGVLGEWEGLFAFTDNKEAAPQVPDPGNDWGNDNWDEGWESFQEDEPTKISPPSLHPLHSCWNALFKKYISFSRFEHILRLLDQFSSKQHGVLIDKGDAQSLSESVTRMDNVTALKMVLLLPYEELQLNYLDIFEERLKREGITDKISNDVEILLFVLSSGIVSTIVSKPSFDASFSYLCYLVGYFARKCQESQLFQGTELIFSRVLFPSFVSELVKADQNVLAGLLVTKYMHINPSLSVINTAEASLRRYLEGQLELLEHEKLSLGSDISCDLLKSTVLSLRGKLGDLIRAALSAVSGKY